jgi:Phosphoinositide 3-kinase C2
MLDVLPVVICAQLREAVTKTEPSVMASKLMNVSLFSLLQEVIPLAWVNIPIFDYKGNLRSGEYKLYMWPIADEDVLSNMQLNPIGELPKFVDFAIFLL